MPWKFVPLGIFVGAYLLFVFKSDKRTLVAIVAALLAIAVQAIQIGDFSRTVAWAFEAINWNVMGIFVGTLFLADVFMKSKVPAWLAELIVLKSPNTAVSLLLICLMTGIISAFVENVATVLIVAPIALALARKLKLNPVGIMIAIAVSSNLQGAATLIGDPPSMLLGGYTGMNFFDFFIYKGRLSIFFAIELGALVSFLVLYFLFREFRQKPEIDLEEKVSSWVPTILLVALIFLLAGASFVPESAYSRFFGAFDATGRLGTALIPNIPGLVCLVFGLIALLYEKFANKASLRRNIRGVDWDTTFFLMAIFVLVTSLTAAGWIEAASVFLSSLIGSNLLFGFLVMVGVSVLLSAFIDNVPYLAAMLPVAQAVSVNLGIEPSLLLFGLLIGASLGGNVTPIGASANIVACGLLKKEGHPVDFPTFMRIGIPFTLAAVIPAAAFLWFVWH